MVDTDAPAVTTNLLDNGRWVEVGVWSDETDARIAPSDDVPLNVGAWWDDAEAFPLSRGDVAPTAARAPSA